MASQPLAKVYSAEFVAHQQRTKRTPELVTEILLRMADGESYASIYRSDKVRFPCPMAWGNWLAADPDLRIARVTAERFQADSLVQDAMDIIDTEPERVMTKDGPRYDNGHVTILKARSDMRMRRAAQINPAMYGDKTLHAGHDGKEIKTEVAMSITQTLAQLREAKRLGAEPSAAIVEARRPEPSDKAMLAKADQPKPPEPGDPGMEFV